MKNFKMLRFVTTVSFGISLACTPNIFAMRQGNTLDTPLKQYKNINKPLYNEMFSTLENNDLADPALNIIQKSHKKTRGINLINYYLKIIGDNVSRSTLNKILSETYSYSYKILNTNPTNTPDRVIEIEKIMKIFLKLAQKGVSGNHATTAQIASNLIKYHWEHPDISNTIIPPKYILKTRLHQNYFKLLDLLPLASSEILNSAKNFVITLSSPLELTIVGLEMIIKFVKKGDILAIDAAQYIIEQRENITARYNGPYPLQSQIQYLQNVLNNLENIVLNYHAE